MNNETTWQQDLLNMTQAQWRDMCDRFSDLSDVLLVSTVHHVIDNLLDFLLCIKEEVLTRPSYSSTVFLHPLV